MHFSIPQQDITRELKFVYCYFAWGWAYVGTATKLNKLAILAVGGAVEREKAEYGRRTHVLLTLAICPAEGGYLN